MKEGGILWRCFMIRHASLLTALTLAASLAMPAFGQQQAAAPAPAQAGSAVRVLVIPFSTLNVGDNQEWIGRAVQEDIIADFGHTNQFTPVAFQGQLLVEDNATAVSLAHKADANLVIRGSAQMVDKDLRITAQMIDARTGDTVTTASVTGPTSDLLKLEDSLSSQLRTNLASLQPPQSAAAQPDASQAAPITYAPAAPSYTPGYGYPSYTTVYAAPTYYSYAPEPCYDYGYAGGPIVVFGGNLGFRGFGHGFTRGFHNGGFPGGFHNGGFGGGFSGGFHGGGGFSHGGGGFSGGGSHGGGGHR
jgi:TolB-like protein